ncbi:MAG TPA: hypothetical protein VL100_03935 [Croceibacterium sp.]|nr:hypothetical protein [Croceibacterium sp.]
MSLRWNRWLCAFLVLVALVYAVLPDGLPLAQVSGSAFSASTRDVAIGCTVRPEIERRALPDRPAPPPPPRCAVSVAVLAAMPALASLAYNHRARAPPVSLPALLTPLSPRAPPAA